MKTKSFILAAGAALLLSAASVQGAQADNGHHHCGGNSGKGVGNECTKAEHRAELEARAKERREHRREVQALNREKAEERKAAWHARRAEARKLHKERNAAKPHPDSGATITTTTTTGVK